jgi:hypothetical protein
MTIKLQCDCHHFVPEVESATLKYEVPLTYRLEELEVQVFDRHDRMVYEEVWNVSGPQLPPANCEIEWDGEDNQPPLFTGKSGANVLKYVSPLGSPFKLNVSAVLEPAARMKKPSHGISGPGESTMLSACSPEIDLSKPPDYEPPQLVQESAEVRVFYHSISLAPMPWVEVLKSAADVADGSLANANTPDKKLMWMQYRLNEMGYLAGAIDTTPQCEIQTQRALFRYTQGDPNAAQILDFATIPTPPGQNNWGWRTRWEHFYGTLGSLQGKPATVVTAMGGNVHNGLDAGTRARNDLVETPAALTNRAQKTRVILDHDVYYLNKDFATLHAHALYDLEFMDRFTAPFQVKITLVSKADADASGAGVDSPKAVGAMQCEWRAIDPPEDMSRVRLPKDKAAIRSHSLAYLQQLQKELAPQPLNKKNAQDNCPTKLGGVRPVDATDMTPFFDSLPRAYTQQIAGKRVFSNCNVDLNNPHGLLGTTGARFIGSYMGGDNFAIQVLLSFENVPDGAAIAAEHQLLTRLADCFGKVTPPKDTDPCVAMSGEMTVWRRTRVARVYDWGTNWATNYAAINWAPVVDNYATGFVILVPPAAAPVAIQTVLNAGELTQLMEALVKPGELTVPDTGLQTPDATLPSEVESQFKTRRAGELRFDPTGMFPIPLLTLTQFEASTFNSGDSATTARSDSVKRYRNYLTSYLNKQLQNWPNYKCLVDFARRLRIIVNSKLVGPGIIVLRTEYLGAVDFPTILGAKVYSKVRAEADAFEPGSDGASTGMDYGMVILGYRHYGRFAEDYLLTHEISHCLFGSHPFTADSKYDHDYQDMNCTMYYNMASTSGNSGIRSGWAVQRAPVATDEYEIEVEFTAFRSVPPYSRERAVYYPTEAVDPIKVFGLASSVSVSGKFRRVQDYPDIFYFKGTLPSVQSALRSLKVKPKVVATRDADERSADYKEKQTRKSAQAAVISIILKSRGVGVDTSSGPMPLRVTMGTDGGSVYPFAGISVTAVDPTANDPFFCGKCLLKLRGWKVCYPEDFQVAPRNIDFTTLPLPYKNPATPCNAKMELTGVTISSFSYWDATGNQQDWDIGKYEHSHKISWESSDGDPASLANVKTREHVAYDITTPVQGPPFNDWADPDQEFWYSGMGGEDGVSTGPDNPGIAGQTQNTDVHSLQTPSLICVRPLVSGTLRAKQWYEYSIDGGATWQHIPGAAYVLEKTVDKDRAVVIFKKTSAAENPNHFHFEVEYPIGPPIAVQPHVSLKPRNGGFKSAGVKAGRLWYFNSIGTFQPNDQKAFERGMKRFATRVILEQ